MTSGTKNWIIIVLSLIILTGVFFLGYSRYPVWHKQEVAKCDTIILHDTVIHTIIDSFPYYKLRVDSIKYKDPKWMDSVIAANIKDTLGLESFFNDYYALHYYNRSWNDTLIEISIGDLITENKPTHNNFSYRFLKPIEVHTTTTIVNNYSKYIYLAGSVSLPDSKYSNFGLYGAFPKTIFGLSYMPFNPGVMATIGIKIIKIK